MSLARVIFTLLLAKCYCGSYESPSSYLILNNFRINDHFFKGAFPKSRENSYESSPYFYPNPQSSEYSDEIRTRSEESNDIAPRAKKEENFSYNPYDPDGPQNWSRISKVCKGFFQSPVNLLAYTAKPSGPSQPLIIEGFDSKPSSVIVKNNGHSAKFTLKFSNSKQVKIYGGPLKTEYILDNIHFHWGQTDDAGSEHLINSRRYSAEVHLVTYNSKYESLEKATEQSKGLAVLAFFYELDHWKGATRNPFVKFLSKITEPNVTYEETEDVFSVADLIKNRKFRYLSYEGSLTTPSCQETVTWLVATIPLKISSKELAQFRKLKNEKGKLLTSNDRPLQKLNRRKVIIY